jgi:hypothetical protein
LLAFSKVARVAIDNTWKYGAVVNIGACCWWKRTNFDTIVIIQTTVTGQEPSMETPTTGDVLCEEHQLRRASTPYNTYIPYDTTVHEGLENLHKSVVGP